MPQVHHPFIDVAVHPAIRARFAAGDAVVLFSRDLRDVLWANGEGARLFGHRAIYDLMEDGPERGGVAFRQLTAAAAQLSLPGDRRGFLMRVMSGFRSVAVQAEVHLVTLGTEQAVMFSAPAADGKRGLSSLLSGFDDPDTHMALLGAEGDVLAASVGFDQLGVMQDTARALIGAAARSAEGLVKRPIPSGSGYLPAAIGRLSDDLYLLFCVETSIGRMDAPEDRHAPQTPAAEPVRPDAEPAGPQADAADAEQAFAAEAVPEGETQEDIDELAMLDGASSEDVEIASSRLAEPGAETDDAVDGGSSIGDEPGDPTEPTELDADRAEAAGDEIAARLPDVGSPELAADLVETAEDVPEAPEEFREVEAQEAASGETNHRGEESTELDADMAETADDDVAATIPPVCSAELAADMVESADDAVEAPEEFCEAGPGADEADTAAMELAALREPADAEAAGPEQPFRFDREARPVRFVWKLDAGGTFAEVSEEFARTVGPHSGDIVGHGFRELAALFDLDPDRQIADLLDRRDTWSGRTVKWPVEGTDLVVPVDLAALPTYSRNREFDGFRGFGIIRVGDAEKDPNAFGLTVSARAGAGKDAAKDAGAPMDETPADEFRGEVPALDIVSNPLASFSDKIIQLEERRSKSAREGLSASEQAALREIARQLEPFGKRPNEDIVKSTSGLLQTEESEAEEAEAHPDRPEQDMDARSGDEDAEDALADFEAERSTLDEASVQTLFEDLGTGPGLTAYAIDQVPLAILIHAGDRLIEANSEFRRLTGYDTMADLERAGGLDALITRREGPDAGVYLVRADGTQVLVSARLQSVRYEGSSALMLALTPAAGTLAAATAEPQIIGESEAARRLAALKVEVDELRSILETATDGVIVLDTEGRIRSMNRSASALFNFDDSETRGKPFAMLFAHESQKSVQDYLAGLAGHGVASVLNDGREVIGREASGGFIPLFMTMGRMPGSNSYCAVIRDITQWKRSEEELRAAKRAAETANQHKSDFLARVSHEIRTPLNAIIGFSDMIANEHFGPAGHPRYVEYAADIGRSGRHVLDIVNDLLDISKIEAGEMELEFAAVGINECISEAVSLVQPQANAQRVIIRTSLSQAVPDVVADLRSIKQIALNILANAIRYTPSGGQIVVSTAYEASGSVVLRIRDTGVGMSKAELEQAMKPFGQVAPGTRQRGDGTGLGLPLTKAMTEANRALFSIHSAPNEGTLVEITFPPQRVLAD